MIQTQLTLILLNCFFFWGKVYKNYWPGMLYCTPLMTNMNEIIEIGHHVLFQCMQAINQIYSKALLSGYCRPQLEPCSVETHAKYPTF